MRRACPVIWILIVYFIGAGFAQLHAQTLIEDPWTAIRNAVLPEFVSSTYSMRDFISEMEPLKEDRKAHLQRVDKIWDYAVYISEGDIETALFVTATATLPYHNFDAVVPFTEWVVNIPVSTESLESFRRRLGNLPSLLYESSGKGGDRDKLPHFFGSAFLQYRSHSSLISSTLGELIEIGEKMFKLEGAYDERDIEVNHMGIAFAHALMNGRSVQPSQYFNEVIPGE